MTKLISALRAALKNFVRKHVVDSEENLWPNHTPLERHEEERRIKALDMRN